MNEKMKLLIAYDGSDCADAALDDLHRAGLPQTADVLVITVAEVWLPPPPPSGYEILEAASEAKSPADLRKAHMRASRAAEEARSFAARAGERLQKNFPGWKVDIEASSGSPAWEVIMRSYAWKPDLIVVGSHGRSALGRFVMGSVSQRILTEARCSVRVARGRVEVEDSPVRVIIGVDGSLGSDCAVRAVASRRWPMNSEARIVIVKDSIVPAGVGHLIPQVEEWVDEVSDEEREWMQNLFERATEELRSHELTVSSSIMAGNPKRVLIEEAEKWRADSVFVGSTGFSNRFERFLLGSVSAAVAARAHCSVEVVREAKG